MRNIKNNLRDIKEYIKDLEIYRRSEQRRKIVFDFIKDNGINMTDEELSKVKPREFKWLIDTAKGEHNED